MNNTSLLLVDDQADILSLVAEALQALGIEVTTACSGVEAIELLKGPSRFDFVFSDVSMPLGVSGVDLATEAARLQPQAMVILASGYAPTQLPSLPQGVTFLPKPYRIHQLLDIMAARNQRRETEAAQPAGQ